MANTTDDIARLRSDIQALQADVGSLIESLKGMGAERSREAIDRARQAGHSLESEVRKLEERAEGQMS